MWNSEIGEIDISHHAVARFLVSLRLAGMTEY